MENCRFYGRNKKSSFPHQFTCENYLFRAWFFIPDVLCYQSASRARKCRIEFSQKNDILPWETIDFSAKFKNRHFSVNLPAKTIDFARHFSPRTFYAFGRPAGRPLMRIRGAILPQKFRLRYRPKFSKSHVNLDFYWKWPFLEIQKKSLKYKKIKHFLWESCLFLLLS